MTGERLPVPTAEAELLISRVDSLIGRLDELITDRSSARGTHLGQWQAPNRVPWDEDFFYGQLDLQTVVDNLQGFKADVEGVLAAIRAHNEALVQPPTGTTTTSTTTTTAPVR